LQNFDIRLDRGFRHLVVISHDFFAPIEAFEPDKAQNFPPKILKSLAHLPLNA